MSPARETLIQAGADIILGWICLVVSCYLFLFEEMVLIPLILGGVAVLVAVVPPVLRGAVEINRSLVLAVGALALIITVAGVVFFFLSSPVAEWLMLANYLLSLTMLVYVMSLVVKLVTTLLDEI